MAEVTCVIKGCDHPIWVKSLGYCSGHYQRYHRGLRGAELEKPIRPKAKSAGKVIQGYQKVKAGVAERKAAGREPLVIKEMMTPMPDQQVAIDKLRKVKYRLCGDSMGVGKTVTGIGLDFAMREDNRFDGWEQATRKIGKEEIAVADIVEGPTLIICEKIGLDVWDYHLQAMGVPVEQIMVIDPTNRDEFIDALDELIRFQSITNRRGALKGKTRRPTYRYYVCHYDVLTRIEQLNEKTPGGRPRIRWAHIIADEVHLIKNRKALRTIELKRCVAEYKTGLSGTPADDKPQDLWSTLHWLYPKKFSAYWRFYEQYIEYETNPYGGYRVQTGVKNIPELHRTIYPFYIRRTLLEVNPNMPTKTLVEPPITVELTKGQRVEYERMKEKAIALLGGKLGENGELMDGSFQLLAPAVIAVWTRLQQMALATLAPEWDTYEITGEEGEEDIEWDDPKIVLAKPSPKLDAAINLITTHEEEPFVVFSQYRGMADLVEEECNRLKIPVVKIHGGITDKNERTRLVSEFQDGPARVFVGTIAAAGKTITLTKAAHAIFTDLHWNPSKNEQAQDRLWRRTQPRPVRIHRIEARDTIDQVRFDKITAKGEWTRALLDPIGFRREKMK